LMMTPAFALVHVSVCEVTRAMIVALPSPATCYRLLEVLSAGRYSFGSAATRRQTANKPAGAYTATTASRPGEQVQLDATPLDVMAVLDDGMIGRAELVLAIDIATRPLSAGVLRPVGANAAAAALLPRTWGPLIAAFVLFRLFDIIKLGPVGWADRKDGAIVVMADDVVAGLIVAAILFLAGIFFPTFIP